jgi:hypothetical protein
MFDYYKTQFPLPNRSREMIDERMGNAFIALCAGSSIIMFPIETTINVDMFGRDNSNGDWVSFRHNMQSSNIGFLQQVGGIFTTANNQQHFNYRVGVLEYIQGFSSFFYNDVYGANSLMSDIKYVAMALDDKNGISENVSKHFDTRIINSNKKQENEDIDSFLLFSTTSYKDYDSLYGPVNNLLFNNTTLYFWQDNAFGIQNIYPQRVLSGSEAESNLVLADGDALDRYEYITMNYGNRLPFTVSNSTNSIYWYDDIRKSIVSFSGNGGVSNISKQFGVQSYVSQINTYRDYKPYEYNRFNVVFDQLNKELCFNLGDSGKTIIYNEDFNVFTGFYNYSPSKYIQHGGTILSISGINNIYRHNYSDINYRAKWYDSTNSNSILSIMVNKTPNITKSFDNIDFLTYSYDVDGIESFDKTWSSIVFKNNYQNSGTWLPTFNTNMADKINVGGKLNIEARERNFSAQIPRDSSSTDLLFNARLRDKFLSMTFTYDNKDKARFVVPYITTNFRYSIR